MCNLLVVAAMSVATLPPAALQPVAGSAPAVAAQNPEKKFTYLNLQLKANQKLTDNFGSGREGNNLSELSKGEQIFEGVRFNIEDGMLQLHSPRLAVPKPESLGGIEVGKPFARLHILHATGYGNGSVIGEEPQEGDPLYVKDGTRIGEYRIHYEDKKTEIIPIVYGEDVRDWWFVEKSKGVTRGKVAWMGDNALAKQFEVKVRLYQTTWTNLRPDVRVVSIDYVKVGDSVAAPFCVAMSFEEK